MSIRLWPQVFEKNEQISDEFCRCLEASSASSRVKDKIKEMYLSSNFETL
jgi:hypothetical protein